VLFESSYRDFTRCRPCDKASKLASVMLVAYMV
jgi:hypothetical protein